MSFVKSSFKCPICLDKIESAFVTNYRCITDHCKGQDSYCPVCRTALAEGDVFPNYALDELIRQDQCQFRSNTEIAPANGSLTMIKKRIAELLDQKNSLEKNDKSSEAEVLLEFLTTLRDQKKKIIEDATVELEIIEKDIEIVQSKVQPRRLDDANALSCSSSEDCDSVPSICPPSKRLLLDLAGRYSTSDINQLMMRKNKMYEFFGELEEVYFDQRSIIDQDETQLDVFSKKLGQITGNNAMKELGSFNLPEPYGGSNIVSCIDFDCSGQFFASGGVSKRIKIFNYEQIENSDFVCTLPSVDIPTSAKISNLSWNPYLKNQLASVDYEGVLTIYDTQTTVSTHHFEEHEFRIWSVDYAKHDPKRLATGSDDHKVKIWSLTNRHSALTIDAKANVCSVQFSPTSANILAIGSADHNVHLFDLRYTSRSLNVLEGHKKAVSYVRFINEHEIVTASTDSSLCLWNLKSEIEERPYCERIYTGHKNEKNFVGLSVTEDYISCGSECNTLYTYHRDITRPLAATQFRQICPHRGLEQETEGNAFISTVCWKKNSNRLVAANSQGIIKIFELV